MSSITMSLKRPTDMEKADVSVKGMGSTRTGRNSSKNSTDISSRAPPPPMLLAAASTARSSSIPIPFDHSPVVIHQTLSQVQLLEQKEMAEERDLHMFYRLVNGIRSRQNNSNTNIYGIAAHTQQQQTHWIGTQKDPLSRDAGINSSDAFISRILQARQVRLDSPFSSNATASTTVPPTVLPVANPGSPLSSSRTEATPPCDGWSITGFEDSFCAADLGGDDETLATVHNSNNDGEEEEDAGVFDLDL